MNQFQGPLKEKKTQSPWWQFSTHADEMYMTSRRSHHSEDQWGCLKSQQGLRRHNQFFSTKYPLDTLLWMLKLFIIHSADERYETMFNQRCDGWKQRTCRWGVRGMWLHTVPPIITTIFQNSFFHFVFGFLWRTSCPRQSKVRPDGGSLTVTSLFNLWTADPRGPFRRRWHPHPMVSKFISSLHRTRWGWTGADLCNETAQVGWPCLQRGPGSTGFLYYCVGVHLSKSLRTQQQKSYALCGKMHFVQLSVISRTIDSEMWHPQ